MSFISQITRKEFCNSPRGDGYLGVERCPGLDSGKIMKEVQKN